MALLEGHLTEDALFAALEGMDRPGLWKGAAAVFSANMGNARLARVCRTGLLRLLDCTAEAEPILLLDRHLADGIGSSAADIELVARLIERIGPRTKSHDIFALPDWLAGTARRNPMAALHLLEKLAARLDGLDRAGPFLHGESLIVALLEILREADDSDDPALIGRAIALQDRFLGLGVIGMEEMLDKATAR
jgi:hypothetical protein